MQGAATDADSSFVELLILQAIRLKARRRLAGKAGDGQYAGQVPGIADRARPAERPARCKPVRPHYLLKCRYRSIIPRSRLDGNRNTEIDSDCVPSREQFGRQTICADRTGDRSQPLETVRNGVAFFQPQKAVETIETELECGFRVTCGQVGVAEIVECAGNAAPV